AASRPGGGFGGGGGGGGGGGAGQEVMPGREAADVWSPSADDLDALRAAGVTTLGLAFDGGIFPGRVAAVHTGSGDSRVLRAGIAQQVLLGRRRGAYPGTLMGAIAFVKQAFYDAQHELRVRQAWERQPTGPRPVYNPDTRALEPAASGALPVWLHGSSARDLGRLVEIARDVGVSNYVIVGAQEGYKAVDVLRTAARPVIVRLDFPSPNQIAGRASELHVAPGLGQEEARERAGSAAPRAARGNAGVVARSGIRFALASYGLGSITDMRAHVRAAIEAGLSPDDALRALTVTPAELLGIDRLVGTIEQGKLANLVVVSGTDPFA